MKIHRSIDEEVAANRKLHYKGSAAFLRLEEILDSRHQPWCLYGEHSMPADELPEPINTTEARKVIQMLAKEELPRALARACVHGDLWIAKTIWSARGPFQIGFKKDSFWTNINGTRVSMETSARHIFTNASSAKDIEALMEWMPTVGLGFMIGVGSEHSVMMNADEMKTPMNSLAHRSSFEGELPRLSDGVLHSPELAVVIQSKATSSYYGPAFDQVLCWVDDDMLQAHSVELSRFEVAHCLLLGQGEDEGQLTKSVPLSECTEELFSIVESRYMSEGEVKVKPGKWEALELSIRTAPGPDSDEKLMSMHLGYQASVPVQHGFWEMPGYTLCLAKTSFLDQFEKGPTGQRNMRASLDFADDYFPLDLVGYHRDFDRFSSVCGRDGIGIEINFEYWNIWTKLSTPDSFYTAFGADSFVRDQMITAVPYDLVEFVLQRNCSRNPSAKSMIALQQTFGIDNKGRGMALDHLDLQLLHDAGYVFSTESQVVQPIRKINGVLETNRRISSSDTAVFLSVYGTRLQVERRQPTPDDMAALDEAYRNAIRLGLWPSEKQSLRPKTVANAMTQISKAKAILKSDNHVQSLLAYLDIAGPDACAKGAKSGEHWRVLQDHFGDDVMRPLIKLAPRDVRGYILEDDLGM